MMLKIITLSIGITAMLLTNSGCSQTTIIDPSDTEERLHISEVNNNQKFKGAEVMNKMSFTEKVSMYWDFFFGKELTTPEEELPQTKVDLSLISTKNTNQLKASWLGHSSILVNIDGKLILTDPIFERKVSMVGPTRFNKSLPLTVEEIEHIDAVVISHDHYDHLNKFSVKQLENKTDIFIVPLRVGKRLTDWGIAKEKIVELNWWDEYSLKDDVTIISTPAQHFSGRGLFDRNSTLWSSWVIKSNSHTVFFSGDTGYFEGFREIGERFGPFDLTFLECGAYNEKWSNIHMMPEETIQAHIDLKGKILQPIHWGTFNLALHPWFEPMERALAAANSNGVILSTPIVGEVTDYTTSLNSTERWWKNATDMVKSKTDPALATIPN